MKKILIISGIHGDEPSGPEALFELMQNPRSILNTRGKKIELDILPLLNPSGSLLKTRFNQIKTDLNRWFFDIPKHHEPYETKLIRAFLRTIRVPYNTFISIHEDYARKEFYLYNNLYGLQSPLVQKILKAVKRNKIRLYTGFDDEKTKRYVQRGHLEVPHNDPSPTLEEYMIRNKKARRGITLEIPGKLPLKKKKELVKKLLKVIIETI